MCQLVVLQCPAIVLRLKLKLCLLCLFPYYHSLSKPGPPCLSTLNSPSSCLCKPSLYLYCLTEYVTQSGTQYILVYLYTILNDFFFQPQFIDYLSNELLLFSPTGLLKEQHCPHLAARGTASLNGVGKANDQ